MKKTLQFYVLSMLMLIGGFASAQDITVSGTVTSADDGLPVPGVNVVVKGSSTGTATDVDGNFKLTVPSEDASLIFSFVGFATQTIRVGNQTVINISLEADTQALEEVIVVGYGVQKKVNLTGAVASVDVSRTLEAKPVSDVAKSLQGVVAGVTITYPSGNLNQEPIIKLRGYGSVNGNSDPLILIDGVEGRLSDINPESIAEISVLKDAASSTIYGARAAFGVILITTKKGEAGKMSVNYSNNFAWSNPMWDIKHAHMETLMENIHVAKIRNNGGAPFAFGMGGQDWRDKSIAWEQQFGYLGSSMNDDTMLEGRDFEVIGGQFFAYRSWDVFGQILNDNAFSQTHDISVSGGTDKVRYNIGYGFNSKEGVYKVNTETLDRHTINANISAEIADWATVNFRTLYTKRIYEEPFNYRAGTLGYLFYATRWPSNFPYGTSDGTYFGAPEGTSFIGPIGFLRTANRNRQERDFTKQTIETVFDILTRETQELDLTANFSISHWSVVDHEKGGTLPLINWWSQGNPPAFDPLYYQGDTGRDQATYQTETNNLYSFNAYANYSNTSMAGHTFNLLGGMNVEKNEYLHIFSRRPLLLDANLPELSLATGDPSVSNTKVNWSVMGFFGRLNYNFKEKVLLEVNGRMDGSSRFPEGDRYAFFPSMSAGYRISEENYASFLQSVKISNFKVRASWGQIGYQDVGQFAFIPIISDTDANWIVNSQREKTFGNPKAVSPSLSWETIETLDFGVDVGLLDNRIEVIFDWFQRTNKDMLGPGSQLPTVFGAATPQVNAGEMQTKGWELTINFKHKFNNDLEIFASGVVSDATAEITKWSNDTGILSDFYVGKKLGDIWGFETDRLFQAADFDINGDLLSEHATQDPDIYTSSFNLGAGDVKYKDLNGDGVVDKGDYTTSNHGDLKVIGNIMPRYEYGIRVGANFKGFDLNVFMQGVGKRDYWAMGNIALPNFHYDVLFAHQEDYWSSANTDAFYARPFSSNNANYLANQRDVGQLTLNGLTYLRGSNNLVPQSRYLQNLSYFRLKELTVGYSLPQGVLESIKLTRLRVYFSGYNLAEASGSFIPLDPETTLNSHSSFPYYGNSLPQSRSYSFGLQITL